MQALKIKCKKCGYNWFPRTEQPYKCPRCQSPLNPKRKAEGATDSSPDSNSPAINSKGGNANQYDS